MKKVLLFFLLIVIANTSYAQMWVDGCPGTDIVLEVIEVKGADVVFEVRLKQASNSMCGSFGLGSTDFVLDYNNAAFPNASITPMSGFCDFVNKGGVGTTVQIVYEALGTSVAINGAPGSEQIVLNLNAPAPTNQGQFDSGVAIIDDAKFYTFGRFTLSGYDGTSPLGLNWAVPPFGGGGSGLSTLVFGLEDGDFDSDGTSFLSVMVLINSSSVLLDLELTSFDAEVSGRTHAKLDWETAMESELSHFIVQRTIDGTSWTDVATVQANGNSNTSLNYSFLDRDVYTLGTGKARFYYRLKSIDVDGTFEFSNVESVIFTSKDIDGGISVQPNPAFDYLEVGLSKNVNQLYNVTYQMVDVSGKIVAEGQFVDASVRLDVTHVATGMYFLSVLHDGVKVLEPQKVVIARP